MGLWCVYIMVGYSPKGRKELDMAEWLGTQQTTHLALSTLFFLTFKGVYKNVCEWGNTFIGMFSELTLLKVKMNQSYRPESTEGYK